MTKDRSRRDAIRKYLRLLGNPYAKEQLIGTEELEELAPTAPAEEVDLRPATAKERAYARKQENQYTLLSVAIRDLEVVPANSKTTVIKPRQHTAGRASLSKEGFTAGCRRIFRQYIPSVERGRLRNHHRDFIVRNQGRSGPTRHLLLQELSKYDLSVLPGMEAHFNRERDELTDKKLKQIERSVMGKEDK